MTESSMRRRLRLLLGAAAMAGCGHVSPQPCACTCACQPCAQTEGQIATLTSIDVGWSATPLYSARLPFESTAVYLYSATLPPSWTATPIYSARLPTWTATKTDINVVPAPQITDRKDPVP